MMVVYLFYLFVGPYLWAAQVIVVLLLAALGWKAPSPGWPLALSGKTAAATAAVIAAVFAVLMAPLALMIALRRHRVEFPTSWTDPPGLACIAQVVLLAAAIVNAMMTR